MKFLIIDDDSDIRNVFSIIIKNVIDETHIDEAVDARKAIELFTRNKYDYVITDYEMPGGNGDLIIKHLQNINYQGYLLLHTSKVFNDLNIDREYFKTNEKWDYKAKPISPKEIKNYFLFLAESSPKDFVKNNELYAKIRILHFFRFNKALTNIFLKLGDNNFVKIINKGDFYRKSDIDKYIQKDQKYLYISHDSFVDFIDRFQLTNFLEFSKDFGEDEVEEKLNTIHYVLKELVLSLGVTPESLELVKMYTNEIDVISSNDQNIKQLLFKLRNKESFEYEHSFMTACLATFLLNRLEWSTREHMKKICMASLLHDIYLEVPFSELDKKHLTGQNPELVKKYYSHSKRSVEALEKNQEIPIEVLNIIEMHHESPDGNGFPRGVKSSSFKPLTCVFIVAHEFICSLYEKDFDESAHKDILTYLFNTYNVGNFKGLLDPLFKTLSLNDYFRPDDE